MTYRTAMATASNKPPQPADPRWRVDNIYVQVVAIDGHSRKKSSAACDSVDQPSDVTHVIGRSRLSDHSDPHCNRL